MNYLVHLYLSGPEPFHQLGGIMGDFVKGPLTDDYPQKITTGLILHRRIDSLAHNSRHTRNSRRRLNAKYGHGRGIIIDIFYDHFLADNWQTFSPTPLENYAESIYQNLRRHKNILPEKLNDIVPRMAEHNWLVSYQQHDVVGRALQRIAQRLSRPLPLCDATVDLAQHREEFYDDFMGFMSEAKELSRQLLGR